MDTVLGARERRRTREQNPGGLTYGDHRDRAGSWEPPTKPWTRMHTLFPSLPLPWSKLSSLTRLLHTCDLRRPVGFGFENKPGSLPGLLYVCLPGSPQEICLVTLHPHPAHRAWGGPCRPQLNLAWQRASVLGQQTLGKRVASVCPGQRGAGGQPRPLAVQTLTLCLARSPRSRSKHLNLPSLGSVILGDPRAPRHYHQSLIQ